MSAPHLLLFVILVLLIRFGSTDADMEEGDNTEINIEDNSENSDILIAL